MGPAAEDLEAEGMDALEAGPAAVPASGPERMKANEAGPAAVSEPGPLADEGK